MENRGEARYAAKSCFVECRPKRLFSFLKKVAADMFPLVNISEGGIQFLSHKEMTRDERVELAVSIPGEAEPLRVGGRVAWVEKMDGRDFYRVGAAFVGMTEKDKGRLLSMVKEGRLAPLDLSRHAAKA